MAFIINGQNLYEPNVTWSVYTSSDTNHCHMNLNVKMEVTSVAEGETQVVIGYQVKVKGEWVDSRYPYNYHEGNGLQLQPYYNVAKVDSKTGETTFAEIGQMIIYCRGSKNIYSNAPEDGWYTFYNDHYFGIPKKDYDQKLHIGVVCKGIYTLEDPVNHINGTWDDLNDSRWPGGHYPFFWDTNTNSTPGYLESNDGTDPVNSIFLADTWGVGTTTDVVVPSLYPNVWYYDESTGIPHKGHAYYYDESGVPHKAKAIYFYDGDGKPIKCK